MTSFVVARIVAVLAGILYGIGWWILIEAFCVLDMNALLAWYHLIPAFISVLGTMIMFVCPRKAIFSKASNSFLDSDASISVKRTMFFIGIMVTLLSLGMSIYFAGTNYDAKRAPLMLRGYVLSGNAPLIALVVTGSMLTVSTFLFKFGRPLPSEGDDYF